MCFYFDWLTIEQDFGFTIPDEVIRRFCDFGTVGIHLDTGELQDGIRVPTYKHKGSYCDQVSIKIRGSVIRMEGNPSRWGKVENLFGFTTIDGCVACFNNILISLGLPPFTRCTEIFYSHAKEGSKPTKYTNGAVIKRIDITTNKAVGKGNERIFIKALSQMRYRNSIGRLHTNGFSTDWLSAKGNANLIYPICYIKHEEMKLNSYTKIKNKFDGTEEFEYYKKVLNHCEENGVVRFEQKLHSRFLQREDLQFWGISDFSSLGKLGRVQEEFLTMPKRLTVTKMTRQDIAEQLLFMGIVSNQRQARTTADYAMRWVEGEDLTYLSKSTFKRHRARLRKLSSNIDIATLCDMDKFQCTRVISTKEIMLRDYKAPDFYQFPSVISLVRKVA